MTEEQPIRDNMGYANLEDVEKYLNELDEDRCCRCKYFDPYEEVTYDIIDLPLGKTLVNFTLDGAGHRHAPLNTTSEEDPAESYSWQWVKGSDWCGEFLRCDRTHKDLCSQPG